MSQHDELTIYQANPALYSAIVNDDLAGVSSRLHDGVATTVCKFLGQSWLHLAAEKAGPDIVKLLLDAGADVNLVDVHGKTPLFLGVLDGQFSVVHLLLAHGADPNAKTEEDRLPLHLAVNRDEPHCFVSLLLSYGADPTVYNDLGLTPMHYTARYCDHESTMALLMHGADPLLPSPKTLRTPLDHAYMSDALTLAEDIKTWLASQRAHQAIDQVANRDSNSLPRPLP